jgi:hypothetical protein
MKPRLPSEPRWVRERDFQVAMMELAHLLGWRLYHTWDSRKSEPGFPDLVMVRDRVVFAELKSPRGRLRKDQAAWLCALRAAGAEAYLWWPGWACCSNQQRSSGERPLA